MVGAETVAINRRLLILEKKEDDRAEREDAEKKGKGEKSKGSKPARGKKKTKKKNQASTEFTEARRSIRFTPCGPTETEVRDYMENELQINAETVKTTKISEVRPVIERKTLANKTKKAI